MFPPDNDDIALFVAFISLFIFCHLTTSHGTLACWGILLLNSVHCTLACVCLFHWYLRDRMRDFLCCDLLPCSGKFWQSWPFRVLWEFGFLHSDRPPGQTTGGLLGVYRKAKLSTFLWKKIPEDCEVFEVKLCLFEFGWFKFGRNVYIFCLMIRFWSDISLIFLLI